MINIKFKGINNGVNNGVSNGVSKWITYILMTITIICMMPILLMCGLLMVVFYVAILLIQTVYDCLNKLFSPGI